MDYIQTECLICGSGERCLSYKQASKWQKEHKCGMKTPSISDEEEIMRCIKKWFDNNDVDGRRSNYEFYEGDRDFLENLIMDLRDKAYQKGLDTGYNQKGKLDESQAPKRCSTSAESIPEKLGDVSGYSDSGKRGSKNSNSVNTEPNLSDINEAYKLGKDAGRKEVLDEINDRIRFFQDRIYKGIAWNLDKSASLWEDMINELIKLKEKLGSKR